MRQVRTQRSMFVGLAAVFGVAWAGCGKATRAMPDGGDGVITTPVAGRHSFDVVAVLRATGAGSLPPRLATNSFTLVLDVDAALAIVGANGSGSVVGVTSGDGRTFRSAGPFTAAQRNDDSCNLGENVTYESFEVTVAGGSLTGSASGTALISCGDCGIPIAVTASLTGISDVTPPALRGVRAPTSPFDPFVLAASEPLPATATARLVADDGAAIDLVPRINAEDGPIRSAFLKPDVVLRAGHAYSIALDGLVDFAGNADTSGSLLRLASFTAAPTVPADGFESATGSVLGGAMVMTAGPLPAIAGNTSLYIGAGSAPAIDSPAGRWLMVRLSRPAGETKLRFSYRSVAALATSTFQSPLRVGSEGATPGPVEYWVGAAPGNAAETLTVAGQTVFAGPVASKEVMLPLDVADEVLVWIGPSDSDCGQTPVTAGLLIDDLRLE